MLKLLIKHIHHILLTVCLISVYPVHSQTDDQISSGQDKAGTASPSVEGNRKSKAISLTYNVISNYEIRSISHLPGLEDSEAQVRRLNEFEVKVKAPIVLKPQIKIIAGFKYQLEEYNFYNPKNLSSGVDDNLEDKNLHVLAMDLNYLRSLDDRRYMLARVRFALNGDYGEGDFPLTNYLKVMASGAYGWKLNPRNSVALGLSLNYTLGRPAVYPIVIWNKTWNEKWGFESILPARFLIRHNVNDKFLLLAGYELKGNSYHITIDSPPLSEFRALELRRSDIMAKVTLEREIYDFLWISADVGYRFNINFDLSKDNSFNNQAILSNSVDPSPYFQISLFVVPPKRLATKFLKEEGMQ